MILRAGPDACARPGRGAAKAPRAASGREGDERTTAASARDGDERTTAVERATAGTSRLARVWHEAHVLRRKHHEIVTAVPQSAGAAATDASSTHTVSNSHRCLSAAETQPVAPPTPRCRTVLPGGNALLAVQCKLRAHNGGHGAEEPGAAAMGHPSSADRANASERPIPSPCWVDQGASGRRCEGSSRKPRGACARSRRSSPIASQRDHRTRLLALDAFLHSAERALRAAEEAEEARCRPVVIDVDGFRDLTRAADPQAGDLALAALADHLRRLTRSSDVLGRSGADEITIVMAGTDLAGAQHCCERLIRELERTRSRAPGNVRSPPGSPRTRAGRAWATWSPQPRRAPPAPARWAAARAAVRLDAGGGESRPRPRPQ